MTILTVLVAFFVPFVIMFFVSFFITKRINEREAVLRLIAFLERNKMNTDPWEGK